MKRSNSHLIDLDSTETEKYEGETIIKLDFEDEKQKNVQPPPNFIKPSNTFETHHSLLDRFKENATPYHMFDLPEESEDEDDEDDEEIPEKKLSFMEKLKVIQTEKKRTKKKRSETEESFENTDLSFIPISLPDLSIHSPFAKSPNPSLPTATILHNEIVSVVNFIDETPQERSVRKKIIDSFTKMIQQLFPGSKVSVYGSYLYNLMLPGSDIDLQIIMSPPSRGNNSKNETRKILFDLQMKMMNHGLIRPGSRVITGAKIPVFQCNERMTGQSFDITIHLRPGYGSGHIIFNKKDEHTISEKNAEYILNYCRICPAYRMMVILLKLYLRQRSMNEVHFGGLSSFGLCLLVMSFFQHHDLVNGTRKERSKLSLGVLLIDFFGLFGIHFNYRDVAIDVRGEGKFLRKRNLSHLEKRDKVFNEKLYILNPSNPEHIVTSGTSKMDLIRKVFAESFHKLTSPKKFFPHGNRILIRILRISDDLLRRGRFIKSL